MKPVIVTLLILYFNNLSQALVLCAGNGGVLNQVNEGASVVIRTACQGNETTLGQVTLPGPDLVETIERDRVIAVGRNLTISIAGDKAEAVGENSAEAVGGNKEIQVGDNQIEEIGKNLTQQVGLDETSVIGRNSRSEVSGNRLELTSKDHTTSAKKLTLTALDQITLKTGRAMIMMKKNGDISITGANITIKGSGSATIKGSKISNN